MSIREYARALRAGWWMILLAMIIGGGTAVAIAAATPATYAGSVTFFVNTTPDTGVSPLQGDQYAQQRVATYVRLVSSERLAEMIRADTGIDETPDTIAASITGESPLNTVLLTATATGTSSSQVLAVTNSVSTQFVTMIRSIDPTVRLQVTSGPALSPEPIAPRKKLDLGLGVFAGLVVGAGVAFTRRALDSTVRTATDLRSATGGDVLGVIGDDRRARTAPLLVGATRASARIEAFRKLRTNLHSRQLPDQTDVIVVTSSVYGEGKSATAANLAITCADGGRDVLLIDADLRRSRVAHQWDLPPSGGLADVLAGTADVDDCLHGCAVDRLTLLPAGHPPADPAQVIGSAAMTELLARLRHRFDIIILDTPPLLAVTDAVIATGQSDGALIVVRYGKTRIAQVTGAVDALDSAGARLIGFVLNRTPARGAHPRPAPTVPDLAAQAANHTNTGFAMAPSSRTSPRNSPRRSKTA